MTEPITDDGFTYYTCKGECGERKMAGLFAPAEIASGELRCMVCMGEIARRPENAFRGRRSPAIPTSRPVDPTRVRRHWKVRA